VTTCPQCGRTVRVSEENAFCGRSKDRSTLSCGHVVLKTCLDAVRVGDRVSWRSNITSERRFGTVTALSNRDYYHVRTDRRVVLTIHRSRITKEET